MYPWWDARGRVMVVVRQAEGILKHNSNEQLVPLQFFKNLIIFYIIFERNEINTQLLF